jgi:hypothetical protein
LFKTKRTVPDVLGYYVLGEDATDVTFTGIERTSEGTKNTLTLKVCDINGNVAEKVFTVWGIN